MSDLGVAEGLEGSPMSARTRTRTTHLCRFLVGVVISLQATVGGLATASPAEAAPCWFPPVEGTVTDPFREPPCPWCAGNRGLEFAVSDRVVVRAAASGRVEFVGSVADIGYVVVRLANGWRHTYGRVTSTSSEMGDVVLSGAVIGRASGMFFFGLRIGDDYADPAPFVGVLRGRPRLIPVDGTAARPAPPPQPKCREPETAR